MLMDVSSEIVHSLLPLFLVSTLGVGALAVGLIEGLAEATASVTKLFSGAVSDWVGKRKTLVLFGYGLSALTKPVFAMAPSVGWVVAARVTDRVGKGIRGAPRGALVADVTPRPLLGAAYGLRQSLDTVGTFAGPLLAMGLMVLTQNAYRTAFWAAGVPAALAVALVVFGVQEPDGRKAGRTAAAPLSPAEIRRLGAAYWGAVAVAVLMALARFSEAFLLLRAESVGMAAALEIKFAHVVNEKDAFHVAAEKFKELVEKETKGELTVALFPNAKLGDERTLLERMKMGIVDSGIITSGPIINFVPSFGVIDLTFLFRDPDHAYKVLDGPIGKKLLAEMESQGWKGLAFGERGFRNLTNSKRPVVTPEDAKGLKIRVMQNPVYVDSFKALGTNAVPMAWTEVLTALQQGTVDGQENPLNVIVAFKLYETQKYLTITRHAYAPAPIIMILATWKKLSPAQQAIVQKAAQDAAEFERAWDNKMEADWLKELQAKGMEVRTPDLKPFQNAVRPVYDQYGAKYGQPLIDSIINTK
jgi:tripartite ATP-independent transporter DctP family solute receptor